VYVLFVFYVEMGYGDVVDGDFVFGWCVVGDLDCFDELGVCGVVVFVLGLVV